MADQSLNTETSTVGTPAKTSRRSRVLWTVLIIVGLVAGGWAFAGHGGHGGHGFGNAAAHHVAMMRLISSLDLSDSQQGHIESIHEILDSERQKLPAIHAEAIGWMLGNLETGSIDREEVRSKIDLHAQALRHIGYQVTDELIALFDSLDSEQRAILAEHLEEAREHAADDDVFGH